MKYVDLVIDNKSDSTDTFYTYACEKDDIKAGEKVYVSFAKGNKRKGAWVFEVSDKLNENISKNIKKIKYVEETDKEQSLTEEIIKTCIWMKKRYLCRYADAVRLFAPSGSASKKGHKRNPHKDTKGEPQPIKELTDQQKKALGPLKEAVQKNKHDIFLLHGITGSGKTEIYMQIIEDCIALGKTAIMLVPEISLTKQIIERFIGRFGNGNIAVLHSRLSPGERFDEWQRIRKGEVRIVIGARSAVFAPVVDIGAVIMDEEHEDTYKSDMTPKYDTLEIAIKRAAYYGGPVILGSATPSVVSYYRSEKGLYRRLVLDERYNKTPLPRVKVADMRLELKEGNKSVISRALYEDMDESLKAGSKVILFLNRRGYSTFISCRECGHVMQCSECGISLTYHKEKNRIKCHYCGHEEAVPEICPSCGSRYIRYFGTGTEKVEEEVSRLFPGHKTARLDMDTARKKGSMEKILDDFGKGDTDILTGTQIVAKGLDFPNVGLVGIISADVSLNIPDFRSAEKTFQLITQASGRAGRGSEAGKVVIQTYTPENYAVCAAAAQDYRKFYDTEIKLREYMDYPPFCDLILLIFDSKVREEAEKGASYWKASFIEMTGKGHEENIFPIQQIPSNISKEGWKYNMLIKCPLGSRKHYMGALEKIKNHLRNEKIKKYNVAVDVNPYSLWRS